jgi:ribosomal-protein-alanine N-acetyltransferase
MSNVIVTSYFLNLLKSFCIRLFELSSSLAPPRSYFICYTTFTMISILPPYLLASYSLQPLAEAHLPAVMAIESVSFGKHHWSVSSFTNELSNQMASYYVLALSPDTAATAILPYVIAYAGSWVVLDEGHITTVASHPDFRGLALGEMMLLQLLGWFRHRQVATATLEVRESNQVAQALYYKYWFETRGFRKRYYQDNDEAALLMTSPVLSDKPYKTFCNQQQAALLAKWGVASVAGWCSYS